MKMHEKLNHQTLAREIAARSRRQGYLEGGYSENQVNRYLWLLFDTLEDTLTHPGGKVSLTLFGILEVSPKNVGGRLKQGEGEAEDMEHVTYVIRYRPSKRIKARLKANVESSRKKRSE
jgi:nucleoid DNA-binding protein